MMLPASLPLPIWDMSLSLIRYIAAEAISAGETEPRPRTGERQPAEPTVERGVEGKPQLVIPGAERITSAELAKRRAAERLKPKVEQKPADQGLFSDESKQTDLVDLARKPPKGGGLAEGEERLSAP